MVLTTLDYLDAGLQQALLDYADSGGTVVIGPKAPSLDSLMRPCALLADALADAVPDASGGRITQRGAGLLILVPELADAPAVVSAACEQAGLTRVTVNHPALDVAVHIHVAAPSSKVIFVANPTAEPIPAEVSTGGHLGTVQEIWDGREVPTDGKTIAETLPPYSIHIYRCVFSA